ncbi:MAG: DUF378 domain-containing protein [Myxococcaceae bacterium]|nr:DUF378 domain-containing protein [Myxococcaceae bacterium]
MANLAKERKALEPWTAIVLAISIIGAINWGLIGFFNWNLIDAIFGGGARETTSAISRVIYAIVGLCGVVLAILYPRLRSRSAHLEGTRRPAEVR